MEKQELRKYHKKLREQMSAAEVAEKSRAVCRQLLESGWYEGVQMVFGYYPLGKEVDGIPFLKQALADGKRVALPRTGREYTMDFFEINSLEQVEEGAFHVMEPQQGCPLVNPYVAPGKSKEKKDFGNQELFSAVMLVPGVVFDRNGNRYGYGKGYYDRYFSRFPQVQRIALAYENQLEKEIEILQTDVKMDCIYTENAEYHFIR